MPTTTSIRSSLCDAVLREAIVARYRSKVMVVPGQQCRLWWTGAVSPPVGHGRLWIGRGQAVIAHRFGYALAVGVDALTGPTGRPVILAHTCDNPLCQTPEHLIAGTSRQNRQQWADRRHNVAGPLRDTRGSLGRARALRQALLDGTDLDAAVRAGIPPVDRDQLPLWETEP